MADAPSWLLEVLRPGRRSRHSYGEPCRAVRGQTLEDHRWSLQGCAGGRASGAIVCARRPLSPKAAAGLRASATAPGATAAGAARCLRRGPWSGCCCECRRRRWKPVSASACASLDEAATRNRLTDVPGVLPLVLPTPADVLGRLGRSSEQAVGLPALPRPATEVGRPKSQETQASPRSLDDALAADAERSWEQATTCQHPGDTRPCPACGYQAVWRVPLGPWRCCRCEPCEAAANPGAVFDYRLPQAGDAS
jgi:hypothetical protein